MSLPIVYHSASLRPTFEGGDGGAWKRDMQKGLLLTSANRLHLIDMLNTAAMDFRGWTGR